MKLKLKNFKIWTDREFDLGDGGVNLISGPSGKGKSTILDAIFFALFGKGTKLITHGHKKCSVELTLTDPSLIIYRQKGPNRLVLTLKNNTYDDDVAQEEINKIFGKMFEATGYISQDSKNSFVEMSPIDKLSFLEKFAFCNLDISELKDKVKSKIKTYELKCVAIKSKLETINSVVDTLQKPDKVHFPFTCDKTNRISTIKNAKRKLKSTLKKIEACKDIITKLTGKLHATKLHKETLKLKNDTSQTLTQEITTLLNHINNTKYIGDDSLKKLEEQYDIFMEAKKTGVVQNKRKELMVNIQEIETQQAERVTEIKDELWSDKEKQDAYDKSKYLNNLLAEAHRYERLVDDLGNLTLSVDYDTLKSRITKLTTFQCPSCSTYLKLKDGSLIETKEASNLDLYKGNLKELKKQKKIEDKINLKREVIQEQLGTLSDSPSKIYTNQISNIQKYINTHATLEKELEIQLDLASIHKMKNKLKKYNSMINASGLVPVKNIPENILEQVTAQQYISKELVNNKAQLTNKQDKLDIVTTNIKNSTKTFLDTYGDVEIIDMIQADIDLRNTSLNEYTALVDSINCKLNKVGIYNEYISNLQYYREWREKEKHVITLELKARDYLSAAMILKTKIAEAESMAISNIIISINNMTQIYLQSFFRDGDMLASLQSYKENKKGIRKPQITIHIIYKGVEYDFRSLSAGEKQRVILAFTLSLSEFFYNKLLLLDETVNNLDVEMTNTVVSCIKEHYKGKQVVIIAHQVVKGVFDKVLSLS